METPIENTEIELTVEDAKPSFKDRVVNFTHNHATTLRVAAYSLVAAGTGLAFAAMVKRDDDRIALIENPDSFTVIDLDSVESDPSEEDN